MISFVLAIYNAERTLKKCLESILTQNYPKYEYEIISTATYKLCADFATDSKDARNDRDNNYYSKDGKYDHAKGFHCFDLSIGNTSQTPNTKASNNTSDSDKRARDSNRITDLAKLQQAINIAIEQASGSAETILCARGVNKIYPCGGSSSKHASNWLGFDLNSQKAIEIPSPPLDPSNTIVYHYAYCANKGFWEINAVLESNDHISKMTNDGGDDNFKYEVGSNLKLIGKVSGCNY